MGGNKASGYSMLTKVLTVIVAVLLIAGLVGGLAYLLSRPTGLYLTRGEERITDKTDLMLKAGEETAFTVNMADGWGSYSAKDCIVKVLPNTDEAHDFGFTAAGETKTYSAEPDLTAAFCEEYAGKGLPVTEEGVFVLETECHTMTEVLESVYGEGNVSFEDTFWLNDYPYFRLNIVSPDGKETLSLPFRVNSGVVAITLEPDGVVL